MSADVLRKAAALMRERAEAATPGPWSAADEHGLLDGAEPAWCVSNMRPGYEAMSPTEGYLGDVAETSLGFHEARDQRNAEHIAGMHPAVALAVADWLDKAARDMQAVVEDANAYGEQVRDLTRDFGPALNLARAYLGEATA